MTKLPLARSADIVVQQSHQETLIYDLITHKAYNLNNIASTVYHACDGKTTFETLKLKSKFPDEIIFLALDELRKQNLIEDNSYISPFVEMNRREVIRKVGLASMIALPIVATLIAPTATNAQSCQALGASCNQTDGSQSNCCDSNARCTNTGTVACRSCLTTGTNTNCPNSAGCCTSQLAPFSNSCCNGVTETFLGNFLQSGVPTDVYRCNCN